MRAGIRVATAAALWAFAFVALAHLHVTPEQSVAPVVGAALWLVAAFALASARPGARARRLVVGTGAAAVVLLGGSAFELLTDHPFVPELVAAAGFLATLQCFAATMAELAFERHHDEHERMWSRVEHLLAAVDVATAVVLVAWATNMIERRPRGRFRVTDLDLAPAGGAGRVLLVAYVVLLAATAADFLLVTVQTWLWSTRNHGVREVPS